MPTSKNLEPFADAPKTGPRGKRKRGVNARWGAGPGWPGGERPPHKIPVLAGAKTVQMGEVDLDAPHSGPQDFEARLMAGHLHKKPPSGPGFGRSQTLAETMRYADGDADLDEIERRCLDPQRRRRATVLPLDLRVPTRLIGVVGLGLMALAAFLMMSSIG